MITSRFRQLQKREKILILILLIVLATVLSPIYVINPFVEKQQNLKKRIAELEWSIVEIKHLKKIRSSLSNNLPVKQNSESMVVIVDRVLPVKQNSESMVVIVDRVLIVYYFLSIANQWLLL